MYYYIKGKYITRGDNFAVIENNGIGYKIYTSESVLSKLLTTAGEVTIYTYLHVREDVFDIYGFLSGEELSMFLNLLSVSGVGPKAALAILSVATPERFALAVITNDIKTITKASGVGPKLAQRVILELKDKLKTTQSIRGETDFDDKDIGNARSEAVSALAVLGYSYKEASSAVNSLEEMSVEDFVREALKKLMR